MFEYLVEEDTVSNKKTIGFVFKNLFTGIKHYEYGKFIKIPRVFREQYSYARELGYKFLIWTGGRGGFKTQSCLTILLEDTFREIFRDRIFFVLRTIKAKNSESTFEMLKELIKTTGFIITNSRIDDCSVSDFYIKDGLILNLHTGCRILFSGMTDMSEKAESREKNLTNIKGSTNIVKIIFDESALISKRLLGVLVPSIRPFHMSFESGVNDYLKDFGLSIDDNEFVLNDEVEFTFIMNPQVREEPIFDYLKDMKYLHNHVNIDDIIRDEPEFEPKVKHLLELRESQKNDPDYKHIWEGEPMLSLINGMVKYEHIKYLNNYEFNVDDYWCINIGIDPAGNNQYRSDETGIVVVGLTKTNEYHVLEDISAVYDPEYWVELVSELWDKYDCDQLVIETNYGGAYIEPTVRSHSQGHKFNIIKESSSKAKHIRFEPIAKLYRQGLVYHIKHFNKLEEQIMLFEVNGYAGMDSPNNVDALVFACTNLIQQNTYNSNYDIIYGQVEEDKVYLTSNKDRLRVD